MIRTPLLTPGQARAVTALLDRVAAHDGVAPVDEAGRLQLRSATRTDGVLHLIVPGPDADHGPIAYASVLPDGTAQGAVDPAHRRAGHGTALLEAIREHRPDARFWAHGALEPALALLSGAGLVPARTLLTMRRDLAEEIAAPRPVPEGVEVGAFDAARDADAWVELNARAFADHPEQGSMTRADLEARMAEPWFDARGFHVARRDDRLLAFVWTKHEAGSPVGEIYVVATAPEAQGTGLASILLARALAGLRERGAHEAELYVEGSSTGAVRLYERMGFEVSGRDVQFSADERRARPEPGIASVPEPAATGRPEAPRAAQESRPVRSAPSSVDLPADRFLERELSWLAFNERVQELSADPATPLLERLRFAAIFASNLDEFFMVRVAGLKRRLETGLAVTGAAGIPPRKVLAAVRRRAHELQVRQGSIVVDQLLPLLEREADVRILHWGQLSEAERTELSRFFETDVYPVLTPLAVDPGHPFPYISGLSLNLAVQLRRAAEEHEGGQRDGHDGGHEDAKLRYARVKVPDALPRFVTVGPADGEAEGTRLIGLEDVIAANLDRLFPGMEIVAHHLFRVTRNSDVEIEEDDAENLLDALERELLRRRFGAPVRLELESGIDPEVRDWLVRELDVSAPEVFELPSPLDLRGLAQLADLDLPRLRFGAFVPSTNVQLKEVETASSPDVLGAMRKGDVLLHHPYDAFSTSVQAFLEQAAADPHVLAIKQTLYRTSGDSPIVDALIDAAEAGKQVLAIVEITARFDERNNISWARKLEQAGVHVVYGVPGLKTHAKLSMAVRQEEDGLRRYCHVGTGNYHPSTARFYEDLGLLTCDESVGQDLTRLFNQLSGYAPRTEFDRLLVAPRSVRTGLIELIEQEIEHHLAGREARIGLKCNSMVDEQIIDALYRASRAGVPVDIVVRGICALRPGVPGLSDTIRVRSILGRFLEHSRIFAFAGGGSPRVLIGSADMMHRNLDRRVEALVEITDPEHIRRLEGLIDLETDEATASWHLGPDGTWTRHATDATGEPLLDAQAELIARHQRLRKRRG